MLEGTRVPPGARRVSPWWKGKGRQLGYRRLSLRGLIAITTPAHGHSLPGNYSAKLPPAIGG